MNLLMLSVPIKIKKRNTEATVKHKDVSSNLFNPPCNPFNHVEKMNRHDIICHRFTEKAAPPSSILKNGKFKKNTQPIRFLWSINEDDANMKFDK